MQFERTNGRWEDRAVEFSFRCTNSLHFSPSRLGVFIRPGLGALAPQTEGMSVGRNTETRKKKPRSYFPRSFTISKKYPGLGENISRVPKGGQRAFEGRRGSEQVPDCREGRSRTAGGGARQPKAHRLCSGRARILLSFASVLPLLRSWAQQILLLDWIEKGACLHGQTHRLHAFAEQSCEGWAGPGRRAEGRWEAGEGRGRQAALSSSPGCAPRSFSFLLLPLHLAWGKFHRKSFVFSLQGLL